MRLACMLGSSTATGIDGGTKRMLRTRLVSASVLREIDAVEIELGGAAFAFGGGGSAAASVT